MRRFISPVISTIIIAMLASGHRALAVTTSGTKPARPVLFAGLNDERGFDREKIGEVF